LGTTAKASLEGTLGSGAP